jgi:hypothetical protein
VLRICASWCALIVLAHLVLKVARPSLAPIRSIIAVRAVRCQWPRSPRFTDETLKLLLLPTFGSKFRVFLSTPTLLLAHEGPNPLCTVSQEQINKDLMSPLVSSCLSVWSGYVHLLFCYSTKSLIPSSKFQVPDIAFHCTNSSARVITYSCACLDESLAVIERVRVCVCNAGSPFFEPCSSARLRD